MRLIITLIIVVSSHLFIYAEVSVSKVDFMGWRDVVEISNGEIKVVVAPQINRIIYYGFEGGENLLYLNEELAGAVFDRDGWYDEAGDMRRPSFGGDRVWPTSESMFIPLNGRKNPPDHYIDGASCSYKLLEDGVVITTPVSAYCGASISRKITIDNSGSRVVIDQSMAKVKSAIRRSLEPVPLTIWNITQVRRPDINLIGLQSSRSIFRDRYMVPFWSDYDNRGGANFNSFENYGVFYTDQERTQKIGSDSPGWVAALCGATLFVESFVYDDEAEYPDGGTSATLFTSNKLTELECLSPLRYLKVGESFSHTIYWNLYRVGSSMSAEDCANFIYEKEDN